MSNRKSILVLALIVLASVLAACGGTASAQSQTASTTAAEPVEVQVTLSETSGGMTIESSLTSFQTGVPYRFVVTNQGVLNHEFMIMPSLEEASAAGGTKMDMEELDAMALAVIEDDDLTPGTTEEITVTFDELASLGTLEFACHVPGHYEAGMRLPIEVK